MHVSLDTIHPSRLIPPINAAQVTLWSRLGLTVVQQVLPGDCVRFYCKSSTPAFSSTVSASFFQIIFFFAIRRTTAFLSHRTATRTEDSGHSESADSPKQPQNTETLKIQRDGGQSTTSLLDYQTTDYGFSRFENLFDYYTTSRLRTTSLSTTSGYPRRYNYFFTRQRLKMHRHFRH